MSTHVAFARSVAYLPQGGGAHWPVTVETLVGLGRLLGFAGHWETDPLDPTREFKVARKTAAEVVDAVFLPENPGELTVWGVANGLTSVAKREPYAEDRAALSRVAGEVLSVR